ncbi:DUF5327 family protein [Halalkalibacter okhensis]|uniref:Uncharacterized protein n=1 Tax=Halalkalibacter okhensis TaxID=333138 RepID=A0A0B0IFE9_9BACI|nr:DUF5327 family protein [Halalkalibacter okhensis]KHF38789.1 hypothetical protein LQ50_19285 [Halalkalibacter okhensis]
MNIPANQICDHIESQVTKLRQAISNGDQATVRETSAVIEAYCNLLKGSTPAAKEMPMQMTPQQSFGNQATPQPISVAKPLVQSGGEMDEKDRNILDF